MRAHSFLAVALCGLFLVSGCGEDEKAPNLPPGNGSGGRGTAGRDGGSTGGSQTGGRPSADAGPDGDIPDGTAPGTGGGGAVPDAPIIVFPPIEGGIIPGDAGTPAPRDCSPTGTATVSAIPCLALAEAECARFQTCTPFTLIVGFGDVPACITMRRRECEATYASPGQAPILDAVHECAARWINAPCSCVIGETCPALAPKPGTLANGAPCYDARQCAGGNCSAPPFECGECATGTGLGELCGRELPSCKAGLTCNVSGVCAKPRERGQHCAKSNDCAPDIVCVNGKCGDHLPAGADCRNDSEVCDPLSGVLCDQQTCVQVEYTEATGDGAAAACGPSDGKLTLCSAKSLCSSLPFTPGQCQPRGGVGASCDPAETAERPACLPGLVCDPETNRCAQGGPIVCD